MSQKKNKKNKKRIVIPKRVVQPPQVNEPTYITEEGLEKFRKAFLDDVDILLDKRFKKMLKVVKKEMS